MWPFCRECAQFCVTCLRTVENISSRLIYPLPMTEKSRQVVMSSSPSPPAHPAHKGVFLGMAHHRNSALREGEATQPAKRALSEEESGIWPLELSSQCVAAASLGSWSSYQGSAYVADGIVSGRDQGNQEASGFPDALRAADGEERALRLSTADGNIHRKVS